MVSLVLAGLRIGFAPERTADLPKSNVGGWRGEGVLKWARYGLDCRGSDGVTEVFKADPLMLSRTAGRGTIFFHSA